MHYFAHSSNKHLITKVWNYDLLQQHFCMFSFFLNNLLFFPPSICRCPICHTNNLTVSILYLEIFLFLLTGVSMLLNHQTNPLVAQLGRCHKVVCMRRKVKKVVQLLHFKFAWKDIIWTDRLSTAKILEPTISKFESHWFGYNTTLVLICDSKQIRTRLGFWGTWSCYQDLVYC